MLLRDGYVVYIVFLHILLNFLRRAFCLDVLYWNTTHDLIASELGSMIPLRVRNESKSVVT